MQDSLKVKKILLFSGGLDSWCLLFNDIYDEIIFFDLETEDNKIELENLSAMPEEIKDKVRILKLPLVEWEMENKIIPHRNSIMTLIAANYGNEIYMGFTAGDSTKDKDFIFKAQVEGMLNYFAIDKHKVFEKNYPFSIKMPFKHLTKAQIVKQYIANGGIVSHLKHFARSCYSGKIHECGVCRACIRKAVALELNNISYHEIFEKDPFENLTEEANKKLMSRKDEREDFLAALARRAKRLTK